eukprot:gnl/Dysnectes_brevis/5034_a7050_568.p1 GENE.gnl/Dysnectes_brevis/5034_a7050_568~~gnl/Dysnectes_brevis/5034_a7050_568.p1  ORF type:complete len:339 (-),score=12.61 gnl/Dysnectes_brevis/5034_a7050_568:146-1162(-)
MPPAKGAPSKGWTVNEYRLLLAIALELASLNFKRIILHLHEREYEQAKNRYSNQRRRLEKLGPAYDWKTLITGCVKDTLRLKKDYRHIQSTVIIRCLQLLFEENPSIDDYHTPSQIATLHTMMINMFTVEGVQYPCIALTDKEPSWRRTEHPSGHKTYEPKHTAPDDWPTRLLEARMAALKEASSMAQKTDAELLGTYRSIISRTVYAKYSTPMTLHPIPPVHSHTHGSQPNAPAPTQAPPVYQIAGPVGGKRACESRVIRPQLKRQVSRRRLVVGSSSLKVDSSIIYTITRAVGRGLPQPICSTAVGPSFLRSGSRYPYLIASGTPLRPAPSTTDTQ